MAQRGIRPEDTDLIVMIGTPTEDGYFVREKDYQKLEHAIKQWLGNFRRVVGKRLVVRNGRVITAYHVNGRSRRRVLRKSRERGDF
jgi:hypothetical protein